MGVLRTTGKVLGLVLALASLAPNTPSLAAQTRLEAEATAAAESWLRAVDANRTNQVWEGVASEVKRRVSRPKWEDLFLSERRALGRTLSRRLVRILLDTEGAIVTFQSSFEKKKPGGELLVLAREEDGRWRVMGYELL